MIIYPKSILRDPAAAGGEGGGGSAGAGAGGAGGAAAAAILAAGGTPGGAGAAGTGAGAGTGTGTGAGTGAGGAAAPKPFYDGLYGADGKIDKAAFDRLPEHLKAHKDVFAKYETVDALLAGFGNAHNMSVKKGLLPLAPDAPAEVQAERKAQLDLINNVPKGDKPEVLAQAYGIVKPEALPAEHWNQAGALEFAKIAQEESISPKSVKRLLDLQTRLTQGEMQKGQAFENDYYQGQATAFAEAAQKQGLDADKALDLATRGANTLGIDPKSPLFKNAAVRLACIRLTNLVSEEKLVTGAGSGGGGVGDELAQARDIMNNPANPLHKAWSDQMHPQHEAAKARWNELYRIDGERKRRRGEAA